MQTNEKAARHSLWRLDDKLWILAAIIPACITLGSMRFFHRWEPWTLTAGLVLMFFYISSLHRRIAELERCESPGSTTSQRDSAKGSS